MMTYIEFFDRTATENICTALTGNPDRVILVGKEKRLMEKAAGIYKKVLEGRGCKTEFIIKSTDSTRLEAIVEAFEAIVRENDRCLFDLTGGGDLYLVAAGIIRERYPDKTELVRFDIPGGIAIDCDGNGYPEFSPLP